MMRTSTSALMAKYFYRHRQDQERQGNGMNVPRDPFSIISADRSNINSVVFRCFNADRDVIKILQEISKLRMEVDKLLSSRVLSSDRSPHSNTELPRNIEHRSNDDESKVNHSEDRRLYSAGQHERGINFAFANRVFY